MQTRSRAAQVTLPYGEIHVYTSSVNKQKRWIISPVIPPQTSSELEKFPSILRQLLYNRAQLNYTDARAFLQAEVITDTSPFLMTGMEAAVERILQARKNHEQVAIYGDYDVDGVTATALLFQTFTALGLKVRGYIPNRFDEGYGLNVEALTSLQKEGVSLIITVDCGIRSAPEAQHARDIGLDLIITDHHQPAEDLPVAYAVVNPKQEGDAYPDKDLAGVGIAFKIAQALQERCLQKVESFDLNLDLLLDLVALGTVADLAPLTGENRMLVRRGLRIIQKTQRQGLYSLAKVAGLNIETTNATNIGFVLGPRLNAAGRLESALASFELLITQEVGLAGELALKLDDQNRSRQAVTREIQARAEQIARPVENRDHILFAVDKDFNSGVVGLAASRLVDLYYRPAVVGQIGEETTRCSCRSIPEFHITRALDQCKDLLVRHGGHAAAAGFTVKNENLAELRSRLLQIADEQLSKLDLRPTLVADMVVPLSEMNADVIKYLSYLQPTGYGNLEPVFVSRNLELKSSRSVGADAKHLKLTLSDGHVTYDAIGFGLGNLKDNLPKKLDVMYNFEANQFNGRTTLQLKLKDIKTAGLPDDA